MILPFHLPTVYQKQTTKTDVTTSAARDACTLKGAFDKLLWAIDALTPHAERALLAASSSASSNGGNNRHNGRGGGGLGPLFSSPPSSSLSTSGSGGGAFSFVDQVPNPFIFFLTIKRPPLETPIYPPPL